MPRLVFVIVLVLLQIIPLSAQQLPAGILFVGVKNETSDIYLWQQSSSGLSIKNISNSPQKEGNACWWERHSVILASREIAPDRYALVALNPSGETVWIAEDPLGSLGWPVPSPWDNRILCVRGFSDGFVQTGLINYPDGSFEPLEYQGLSGGQLAWISPEKILLSRVTSKGFSIHTRDLVSGEENEVVSGGQNWQSHVNYRTGRKFFVRRVGQTGSIFELKDSAAGQFEYENVTNARTYDWQPSTDSDGETLIYRSLRQGFFSTVVRDLSTGNEKTIETGDFSQIYFPVIVSSYTCSLFNR